MYVPTYVVLKCSEVVVVFPMVPIAVDLLKTFQVEFGKMEKDRQELCNAEKLFDLSITAYPDLVEVDRELNYYAKILDLYVAQKVHMCVHQHTRVLYICTYVYMCTYVPISMYVSLCVC